MYNASVRFNDIYAEIKTIAMLETRGVRVVKRGGWWDIIGMDDEERAVVYNKAESFYAW